MTSICQLLTNYNKTSTSKTPKKSEFNATIWAEELWVPSGDKNSLKIIPQNKITLMSWSILKNLYNKSYNSGTNKYEDQYKNQKAIVKKINDYIMEKEIDILFTQESIVSILNYTSISTTYNNSAIGIYLKKNVFEIDLIVRSYYNPESKEYEQETPPINLLEPINKYNIKYTRPIIAIRLKHIETKQYFIFVNVLFQVEYETKAKDEASAKSEAKGKYESFKTNLESIINGLYKDNDRIIIAGDFSGISKFFTNKKNKINNFDKININGIEIPLFLNQFIKNNTCCGSNTSQLKFDTENPNKLKNTVITDLINNKDTTINFLNDLLYDSQKSSFVNVDTEQKTAYHYPIIGTIKLGTIEEPIEASMEAPIEAPIEATNTPLKNTRKNSRQSQSGQRQSGPQQSGPRQSGPRQSGPQQSGPQQSGPQQSGPRQSGPQQSGPQQSGPRQSGPRQSGPRQSGPRQSGPRQSKKPLQDEKSQSPKKETATPTKTTKPTTTKILHSKFKKKASESHVGGNIKHTNLAIKSKKLKKLKKTKKLRKLKKLRN
jgi:hypothetical protein